MSGRPQPAVRHTVLATAVVKEPKRRLLKGIGIFALLTLIAGAVAVRMVITRAGPILRSRVIETLSNRFDSKVELDGFQVSLMNGIDVSGTGLTIFGATDPNPYQPGIQPLIAVQEFRFHTTVRSLFRSPMRVATVYVKGLGLNIPPKNDRAEMKRMGSRTSRMSIVVDNFVCENATLLINTSKPDKPPLEFAIGDLKMKNIGRGQPLQFNATLVNPKPVGDIQSSGLFGPLQQASPRDTPVQGNYSFSNADLGTIKGIGGILASTGKYAGTLGNIAVDGKTDTPDFQVATSGHPVHLHTEFHALVDGTSGDTYLRPVNATFLHTSFTASGSVVRTNQPKGHDIELEVVLERARIEDLLKLGVHTDPPIMSGPVQMTTRLNIAPGSANLANRLKLAGTFHVLGAHFENEKTQARVNSLSLRTQGKKWRGQADVEEDVPVDLQGKYNLNDGLLTFASLHFVMPGAHVDMTGIYTLDGQQLDLHGKAGLEAKVSQMTTGWKAILLKPVDPFFSKNGFGTEVPIRITGTQSEPRFALDFGHKDERGNAQNTGTSSKHRD